MFLLLRRLFNKKLWQKMSAAACVYVNNFMTSSLKIMQCCKYTIIIISSSSIVFVFVINILLHL